MRRLDTIFGQQAKGSLLGFQSSGCRVLEILRKIVDNDKLFKNTRNYQFHGYFLTTPGENGDRKFLMMVLNFFPPIEYMQQLFC